MEKEREILLMRIFLGEITHYITFGFEFNTT